jgi:hypothetical protein
VLEWQPTLNASTERGGYSPQKILKKCLALPMGIVTRGVILRALGGNMRQFKTSWPRALPFRLLLVVAGALMLMAALVPRANADVLVYFNFEDAVLGGPFDPDSDDVPANPGGGLQHSTVTTNMTVTGAVNGFLQNRTAGDIDTADPGLAMGMRTTPTDNGHYIQFAVNATFFGSMSLSFAVNTAGNGFNTVQLVCSTDGGGTFPILGPSAPILTAGVQIITLAVPSAVDTQANVVLRLVFNGGTSSGQNLQTIIDNIQLNGAIVPEPATVAGGLLGVLGLCWFQRRRLIGLARLPRLRRT